MQNLWQILQKLKPQFSSFSKKLQEAKALGFWEQAVGSQIAKHAKAYKVEDGVLFIEVDHPAWQAELHARRKQILALINDTIAKEFKTQDELDKSFAKSPYDDSRPRSRRSSRKPQGAKTKKDVAQTPSAPIITGMYFIVGSLRASRSSPRS